MWKKALICTALLFLIIADSIYASPPIPGLFDIDPKTGSSKLTNKPIVFPSRLSEVEQPAPFSPALTSGINKILLILIQFPDRDSSESVESFNNLVNGPWSTGSLNEYFREVSYGLLGVSGTTVGWYDALNNHTYYADNDGIPETSDDFGLGGPSVYPHNAARLVEEAVAAAHLGGINFADYDNDGDQKVDTVFVVYAGTGADTSDEPDDIWPHHFFISKMGGAPIKYDGVTIDDYIVVPERNHVPLAPDVHSQIGVFAHEYGHALGLPDLYDTDDPPTSEGIGKWGLMGSGPWNGDPKGSSPAHPCAWSKWFLGWVTPIQVTIPLYDEIISQAETNKDIYQLLDNPNGVDWTWGKPGVGEYFLVENRHKTGFDKALPGKPGEGEGLLIWHIDESRPDNKDDSHRLVDLEEADGDDNPTEPTDPYADSKEGFTDGTNPSSKLYDGRPSGIKITNISAAGSEMTADFFPQPTPLFVTLFFNQQTFTPADTRIAAVTVQGKGYTVDTYLQVTGPDSITRYAYYEGGFTEPSKPLSFTSQKRSLTGVQWEVKDTTWTFNIYTFTDKDIEGSYTWKFWYEDVNNPGKSLAASTATYTFHKTAPPPTYDDSAFIADITVPDGSIMQPNQSFTKVWRIKNTGTTTWNSSYKWHFDSGDKMSAPDYISIPQQVSPGQTVDLSVPMIAPVSGGTHTGYWRMKNPQGQFFGVKAYVLIQAPAPPDINEGDLVKAQEEFTIYLIKNGQKWPFLSEEFFLKMGYDFGDVKEAPKEILDAYPLGHAIVGNGTVIKKPPEATVWLIEGGKKRPFADWDAFLAAGFKNEDILEVTQAILDMFPNGDIIHSTDDIIDPPEVPPPDPEDEIYFDLKIRQEDTNAYFFAVDDGMVRLDVYKEDRRPDLPTDHIHDIIVTDLDGNEIFHDRMDDSESEKAFDINVPKRGVYRIYFNASINIAYWFEITSHKLVLDISKGLTLHDKDLGSDSATNLYFYAPKGTFNFTFQAHHRDNFWCRVYDSADHEIGAVEIFTMDHPITGTFTIPDSEVGRMYRLWVGVQDVTITSDKVKYMSMGGKDNPNQKGKRALFDPEWKTDELWFRDDYVMYFKPTTDNLSLEVVVDDFNHTEGTDDLSIFVYNDQDQEIFHGTAWDPEDGNPSHMRYLGYYPFDIPVTPNKVYRVKFYNEGYEAEINHDFRTNSKHIIRDRIILNERLAWGDLYFYAPPNNFTLEAVTVHGTMPSRQTLWIHNSQDQQVGYLTLAEQGVRYLEEIEVPEEEVGKIWRLEIPSEDFRLEYTNIAYFSTSKDALFDFVKPETKAILEGAADSEYHFTSAVTIKFAVQDYISGVDKTFYRLNGGDWLDYNPSAPPIVNDTGDYTLEYYSVDKEGNREDVKSLNFSATVDKTAPTVLSFYPQEGDTDVLVWSNIEITFSEPMEKTSTESAFFTQPVLDGVFYWNNNTLVFDPDSPLLPSSVYVVIIRNSARDLHGNSLSQITWSFTTQAKLGDVSGDGKLSSYDASLILKETVGLIALPDPLYPCFTLNIADVDGDKDITAFDASLVLQYAVGKITQFPVEQGGDFAAPVVDTVAMPIRLGKAKLSSKGSFIVPIKLQNLQNVFAVEFVLNYDANLLKITQVSYSDNSEDSSFVHRSSDGKLYLSLAKAEAFEKKLLVSISFEFTSSAYRYQSEIPVAIEKLRLNQTPFPELNLSIKLVPANFVLLQNYPNPFNPETWIPYQLPEDASVEIAIYNIKGQLVKRLFIGQKRAGFYIAKGEAAYWDGRNSLGEKAGSGLYFYNLKANNYQSIKKMVILK